MEDEIFQVQVFDAVGDAINVSVDASPNGEAHARSILDIHDDVLAEWEKTLDALLTHVRRDRSAPSVRAAPHNTLEAARLAAQTLGERLFKALFADSVEVRYRESLATLRDSGRPLQVHICLNDPRHARLPWELLWDPVERDHLALSRTVTLVRFIKGGARRQLNLRPPLRILGITAAPEDGPYDSLNIVDEWAALTKSLTDFQADLLANATRPALRRALRSFRPQIVHFMGHGWAENDHRGLVLETADKRADRILADEFGAILKDCDCLALAFINACFTGTTPSSAVIGGVATVLAAHNVPAVIAMQSEVADRVAIKLAEEFYRSFALGNAVDVSLSEARRSIWDSYLTPEWAIPVLYLRAAQPPRPEPTPTKEPEKTIQQSVATALPVLGIASFLLLSLFILGIAAWVLTIASPADGRPLAVGTMTVASLALTVTSVLGVWLLSAVIARFTRPAPPVTIPVADALAGSLCRIFRGSQAGPMVLWLAAAIVVFGVLPWRAKPEHFVGADFVYYFIADTVFATVLLGSYCSLLRNGSVVLSNTDVFSSRPEKRRVLGPLVFQLALLGAAILFQLGGISSVQYRTAINNPVVDFSDSGIALNPLGAMYYSLRGIGSYLCMGLLASEIYLWFSLNKLAESRVADGLSSASRITLRRLATASWASMIGAVLLIVFHACGLAIRAAAEGSRQVYIRSGWLFWMLGTVLAVVIGTELIARVKRLVAEAGEQTAWPLLVRKRTFVLTTALAAVTGVAASVLAWFLRSR